MTPAPAEPRRPAMRVSTENADLLPRWSLRRLVPVVILATSLLVCALGFGLQRYLQAQTVLEAAHQTQTDTAADLARHYANSDTSGLAKVLEALIRDPSVKTAILLDEHLRTLATSQQTAAGVALALADWPSLTPRDFTQNTRKAVLSGNELITLAQVPLSAAPLPDRQGWLLIQRDLAPGKTQLSRWLWWQAALVMTASLLTALLLWALFERALRQRTGALRGEPQRADKDSPAPTSLAPASAQDEGARQYLTMPTHLTASAYPQQGLALLARAESGADFWDQLTQAISTGLNVRWSGIALLGATPATMEVIAFRDSGVPAAPFSMDVLGSPWALTPRPDHLILVPKELSALFTLPGDLAQRGAECYLGYPIVDSEARVFGVVWAINDQPCVEDPAVAVLLALAAQRVASERLNVSAQDTLQVQQERLNAIVRAGRLAIWEWHVATGECYFGGNFATILGCDREDLAPVLETWRTRIHAEDVDGQLAAIAALTTGLSVEYVSEYRVRRQDGTWAWVHDQGQIVQRDGAGQALRIAGVAFEITERKLTELALVHERTRIETVIRAGNLGFWEWDLAAARTDVHSAALDYMDVSPGQVQDVQAWLKLIHPDDYPRFIATGTEHLKGNTASFSMEARFRGRDGWSWQLVNGQVVERDVDGRAQRLVGTHVDVTSLRNAEANVQINQQRLLTIVEAADLGVWDWEIASSSFQTNQWLERTLGVNPPALGALSGSLGNWLDTEERQALAQNVSKSLREGSKLFEFESTINAADGRRKTIMSRGRVTERNAQGRAVRMVGINVDISEKRAMESRIRLEEQRLQLVVSLARLGLWDFDLLSGRTVVNQHMLQLVGDSREVPFVEHFEWAKFIHPEDLPRMEARLAAHCAGETAHFETELRLLAADGRWIWMLSSGAVGARDEYGRPLQVAGVFHDITSSKAAEAASRASEMRLRAVFENSPVGIFLTDPQGVPLFMNPLLRDMLGFQDGDILSVSWSTALAEGDRARVLPQWALCLADGRGAFSEEFALIRPGTGTIKVWARAEAVRVDGELLGFVGAVSDITDQMDAAAEREQLQNQLLQTQKMDALGQLTGGIAHDFNNVLASILGYTSLAQALLPEHEARISEYLSAVMTAGERARELVAKMLEFSRNAPREDLRPINPAPLIDEVCRMMAAIIPSSIQLRVDNALGAATALIDPSDLHQLLVNLIVNARDALVEHGLITVSLLPVQCVRGVCSGCHSRIDASYLVIDVTDDGEGIDPGVLSRIFDPFFTTKSAGKGTGMGLSVVHGIMHRGRGHIIVTSTPGVGTRFRLLFPPALGPAAPALVGVASSAPAPRGGGRRLLVVDDEPLVSSYLTALFELHGYEVDTAADGVEALALLQEHHASYSVLLTDQTMPRMTGTELARKVRQTYPNLPIVLCTGYSGVVSAQTAHDLGISRFFHKPVAPELLLSAVASLVETTAA